MRVERLVLPALLFSAAAEAGPQTGWCDANGLVWVPRCGACAENYVIRQGASGGTCTVDLRNSVTPPATCDVGQTYYDTNAAPGSRFLVCTSANTWTGFDENGAAGSGDVTAVGPACSTGDCLTDGVATSGTALFNFEGVSVDGFEYVIAMPAADPLGDLTWTFPTAGGTVAKTADAAGVPDDLACTACADATDLGADSVSASELNTPGVEAELEAALDIPDLQGQVSDTQIADGAVDGGTGGEVADDSLTAADFAAMLTFADGDLLDLDAINCSGTGEGILLPQATDCSAATAEGQVCWETDRNRAWIGDGAAAVEVSGQPAMFTFPAGGSCAAGAASTTECSRWLFGGTSAFNGTLAHTITGSVFRTSGTGTCAFRVKDKTNATTICTSATTTSSDVDHLEDCPSVTNVPTAAASMVIEIVVSGTANCFGNGGGVWVMK